MTGVVSMWLCTHDHDEMSEAIIRAENIPDMGFIMVVAPTPSRPFSGAGRVYTRVELDGDDGDDGGT